MYKTSASSTFEEDSSFLEREGVGDAVPGGVQLCHDSLQAAMLLYELQSCHTTNACIQLATQQWMFPFYLATSLLVRCC